MVKKKDDAPPTEDTLVHDGITYGPPGKDGRRKSRDGTSTYIPGNEFDEFERDGTRWVRLPDGREMTYEAFRDGAIDGSIDCSNPFSMLY